MAMHSSKIRVYITEVTLGIGNLNLFSKDSANVNVIVTLAARIPSN